MTTFIPLGVPLLLVPVGQIVASVLIERRQELAAATRRTRPAGFEPATLGLEGRCSVQLSYGRPLRTDRDSDGETTRERIAAETPSRRVVL